MAEALYRKYRPQVFDDVVGQDHIEQTLRNAIAQDKVSHAYLFCGPRGTGKTTSARLLAKALLCENGPTAQPDGTCADCQMIANGEHPDVYELDAASRTGVENVREEIIGRVQFAPTRGTYKVYIIDEVHMLSTAAFNALLKTLEEPPGHVVFILCTTDPQKVPETIHSRCQRFDFRRISLEYIVGRLGAICQAEGVTFEGQALELIAHRAEGGMRNALTALEQVISFGGGNVSLKAAEDVLGSLDSSDLAEIMAALGTRNVTGCFAWVAKYAETGADLAQFTRDLAEHTRNLYIMALGGVDIPLDVNDALRTQMKEQLPWFGPDRLARMMGVLGDLMVELKTSTNPRLSFEIACTRLVRPESDLTLEALAERVEALEMGNVGMAAMAASQGVSAQVPVSAQPAQVQQQSQPAQVQQRVQQQPQQVQQQSSAQNQRMQLPRVDEAAPVQNFQQQPQVQDASQGQPVRQSSVIATTQDDQPQAAPAGGMEAVLSNPIALQRAWGSALTAMRKEKPAYAVLLMSAKAVFDSNKKMLMVDFPADADFPYKAVQKPEVTEELDKALRYAFGGQVPFSYVQSATGASAVAPQGQVQMRSAEVQGGASQQQAQRLQAQRQAHQMAAQQREQARQAGSRQLEDMQMAQPQREQRVSQHTQQRRAAAQQPQQDDYDRVPLDAYDDVVPPEADGRSSDIPPWESVPTQAAQQRRPARQQEPTVQYRQQAQPAQAQHAQAGQQVQQHKQVQQPQQQAQQPQQVQQQTQAPQQSSPAPSGGMSESPEQMGAMLTQVFGEAIRFKDDPVK